MNSADALSTGRRAPELVFVYCMTCIGVPDRLLNGVAAEGRIARPLLDWRTVKGISLAVPKPPRAVKRNRSLRERP